MKTKYILIGLMMLSSLLSYAQNTFECEGLISSSMKLYEEKAFSKALTTFKKVISNKCTLTNSDYYNGACIASLAKNKILALSYLQTSINKGFDNEAHMAKDTDLDFIRKSAEYKNLIGTFAKKKDAIKMNLQK